jgi:hypothetical protein
MSEIKSAVEIALEKTKGLDLSREEKEKLREEEIDQKARSLVTRYLEVDFNFRDCEKELSRIDPEQRPQLEKRILHEFGGAIQLDRDNDLIFQGIEALQPKAAGPLGELKSLLKRYREKREREYRQTEENLQARFASLRISGSAVQVNVDGSQEWERSLAAFQPPFEKELRSLKEKIEKETAG